MPGIPYLKLVSILLTLGLVFGSGWGIRAYIANAEATKVENQHLKDKQAIKDAVNEQYRQELAARDAREKVLQSRITQLDMEHAVSLDQQLAENQRLRGDLSVARRMSVNGARCTVPAQAGSGDTPAGSVGDAASCELGPEARRAVFDLRDGLLRQREQVHYLQGYIRELGLEPITP